MVNETAISTVRFLYESCWKKAEQIAKAAYKRNEVREQEVLKELDRLDSIEEAYKAREEAYKAREEACKAKEASLKAVIAQKDAEIDKLALENQMLRELLENLGGHATATSPLDKKGRAKSPA